MSNRPQKAREYFEKGYNCSQAVLLAFSDVTNLDEKTASRISSSFGGGMGRLREVCGALTGAFMAAGLIYGYTDVSDSDAKAKHYERIQHLGLAFKEKYGTFLCRELLELDILHDIPVSESRTPEYYRKRKCSMYVEYAAKLLDDYIIENGVKQ
ncbi:MAG: C_GCAxxG_C_C family protein [Clostridiales bacterium]|jgi:C_GCAxxG_C_C family probable redox protein|nr:C_GCAxxG_C_C family protein [Clostridiales bacterium]